MYLLSRDKVQRVFVAARRVSAGNAWARATALCLAVPVAGHAQPSGDLPSDARRATDPSPTPLQPRPNLSAEPRVTPPPAPAPGEARFLIQGFDVSGNTLLDQGVIERTVYPFVGPDRTVADVERARAALENVYRARGFQSVFVAQQGATDDNYVRLVVSEAAVGRLRVSGANYYSPGAVRAQVPALEEGAVPNLTEAQRELAALERTGPDRRVTPEITPGIVPGTIDVTLRVEDSLPLHASVSFTNDHSPNTGPYRILANARATDLWQLGHTLSFTYLVDPQKRSDSEVYAASYLAPIANSPWSVLIYGYKANNNVALLGGSTVLGNGYAIGVRGILAMPRTGNWSHSFNFGADFKDFIEDTNIPGPNNTPLIVRAPIRYVPAQFTYSTQRVDDASTLGLTLSATLGLRAFDEPSVDPNIPQFGRKTTGARENFVHVNAEIEWNRTLKDDTRLIARGAAQYADGPLIANEQFSAGGIASVRGYLQSEAVGDDGFSGTLEARTPSFNSFAPHQLTELRGFAFLDGSYVAVRQPLAGQTQDFSLLGLGVGLRAAMYRFLTGDVQLAVPMFDGQYTRHGDFNVQFNVKAEF
jgi:hemolysin activation/secretion protein